MFRSTAFAIFRTLPKAQAPALFVRMASSAAAIAPIVSAGQELKMNGHKKRPFEGKNLFKSKFKKRKGNQDPTKFTGSHDEVLLEDVRSLLSELSVERKSSPAPESSETPQSLDLPSLYSELDLTVKSLSSTGDGLAVSSDLNHVYIVPFTVPGDSVRAKVYKQNRHHGYSLTHLVSVITAGDQRDDSLISCKYFGTCSGCQFQMLSYNDQLAHKRRIVEKAYRNFSGLPAELVPNVGDTIGSPLQFGYRTKLTPHFDAPPGSKRSDGRKGIKRSFEEVPPIGFMKKGTMETLDIEDCPIGTEAVRLGMKRERRRVGKELDKYHKGATILLRENTNRILRTDLATAETTQEVAKEEDAVSETRGDWTYLKNCVTDSNARTLEYIDDFQFANPAGAFFQNNNSILPTFTQYIRDHILPPEPYNGPPITNLIDAYSGSGLFTITLSQMFKRSIGIDISPSSIEFAKQNARSNNLAESHADFMAADAAKLFEKVTSPASETVVVIDPPRKGCDENFLGQLLKYSPSRVVYVSCNVHTQARDVGVLVSGLKGVDSGFGEGQGVYEIESLVGFDFFPQTGHVEGVAVLRKRKMVPDGKEGIGADAS